MAAVVLSPGLPSQFSAYDVRWAAVALVLVAVLGRTDRRAAVVAAAAAGAAALYYAVAYTVAMASGHPASWPLVAGGTIVVALSALQLLRRPMLDPVVIVAVQLGAALLCRWLYYVISGVGLDPAGYRPETPITPFQTELPLLALGVAAVGFGISRSWRPAAQRLGLELPRWWHVALALAVADLFIASTLPVNILTYRLMPDEFYRVAEILYKTYAPLPAWAIVLFAVLAGTCEETLFRGALQPRAGIVLTAVLFASIHIQYGFTPILAMVFVHGVGYGLLRRYLNLPTAIIAHSAYDSGGFPMSRHWEAAALWATVLVIFIVIDLWRRRRNSPPGVRGQERVRVREPVGERREA